MQRRLRQLSLPGNAWTPSERYVKDQAAVVDKALSNADIVITTAQIPGRNAPRLVHGTTLAKMKAGSVLIDMAAGTGGDAEGSTLTKPSLQTTAYSSLVLPNIPSFSPRSLRICMPNNLVNFITTLSAPASDDALQQVTHQLIWHLN